MTAHTQGSWKFIPSHYGSWRIEVPGAGSYGGTLVLATRTICPTVADQSIANGRLMASSPKLLAALRACLRSWHPKTNHDVVDYDLARAAIAEATGEGA